VNVIFLLLERLEAAFGHGVADKLSSVVRFKVFFLYNQEHLW